VPKVKLSHFEVPQSTFSAVEKKRDDRRADDRKEHRQGEPHDAAAGAEREDKTALEILRVMIFFDQLVITQIALRAVKW
jgi:hypothetical protein